MSVIISFVKTIQRSLIGLFLLWLFCQIVTHIAVTNKSAELYTAIGNIYPTTDKVHFEPFEHTDQI